MPPHPVDIHVGKRLRLRRSMLGLSQDYIGKEIGVTFQQIQKYERGINRVGSSRLYDLSRIMSTTVSYFFEEFDAEALVGSIGFAESSCAAKIEEEQIGSKETLTLIRAYYKITDPAIRKKVLGLIKAMGPVEAKKEAS